MHNLFLICRNYVQTYNVIINSGHIFFFQNGYICTKQTDKNYYYRRHWQSRVYYALRQTLKNSKALFILPFALKTHAFATSLRRFSQSGLKMFVFILSCVDCASFMSDWDKPRSTKTTRKHNEFRTCALLVPNVRLALV